MESYIPISYLNDYLFCPRSIYMHGLYLPFNKKIYQGEDQILGIMAHKAIDGKRYSTRKDVLQGMFVYSEKLNLVGKIDTFDIGSGVLTEKKRNIKKIHEGYLRQLFAQYFCLLEMGYFINELKLYSMVDNKSYQIPLPNEIDYRHLKMIIASMRRVNVQDLKVQDNVKKCKRCIYNELCHEYDVSK